MDMDFVAHHPDPCRRGFSLCGWPLIDCVLGRFWRYVDCEHCRRNAGNLRINRG